MAIGLKGFPSNSTETPLIRSGHKVEKEAIQRELQNKLTILESQKDEYIKRMVETVEDDINVKDIKRRLEENNLAMLKLMEANDILRNAVTLYIEEIEVKFREDNPQTFNEDIDIVKVKIGCSVYQNHGWNTTTSTNGTVITTNGQQVLHNGILLSSQQGFTTSGVISSGTTTAAPYTTTDFSKSPRDNWKDRLSKIFNK